jgi:hypothetical protein
MKFGGDLVFIFGFIAIAALFINNPNAVGFLSGASNAYVGALQGAANIGK